MSQILNSPTKMKIESADPSFESNSVEFENHQDHVIENHYEVSSYNHSIEKSPKSFEEKALNCSHLSSNHVNNDIELKNLATETSDYGLKKEKFATEETKKFDSKNVNAEKSSRSDEQESSFLDTSISLLAGESIKFQENTKHYSICLTNYRFHVKFYNNLKNYSQYSYSSSASPLQGRDSKQEQLFCLPINNIDSVEVRDLYFLTIFTKYIESFVITFQDTESAIVWHKRLSDIQNDDVKDLFCFKFYENLNISQESSVLNDSRLKDMILVNRNVIQMYENSYSRIFLKEFNRMQFNKKFWRISKVNENFNFCNSYPEYFIVPREMNDESLNNVAGFRYSRRIPVVVWRSKDNGCVILRSSQPIVGWLGYRNDKDEKMLKIILKICIRDSRRNLEQNKLTLSNNHQSINGIKTSQNDRFIKGTISNGPESSIFNVCNVDSVSGDDKLMNGNASKELDSTSSSKDEISHNHCNIHPNEDKDVVSTTINSSISNSNHTNMNGNIYYQSTEKLITDDDHDNKLLILDARSYTAAFANRAMGGGCECPEYYTNCDVQFMGLNNIHSIRKSFYALRYICESSQIDNSNWWTLLDNTKWLHNLASLLKAAVVVVDAISIQERPVLVHCSDGWDRTPQVVALAELMLDPYYRTIDGFMILIEKEWLQFGHKFADRSRSSTLNIDPNERCPVFLQWVDCVHQLLKQFPSEFEFNVLYLVKLVYHSYSCLFGTFNCNNIQERREHNFYKKTISLWSYFELNKNYFINYLYSPKEEILRPSCRIKDIIFWNEVYVPTSNTTNLTSKAAMIACNGICNTNSLDTESLFMPQKNVFQSPEKLQNHLSCDEMDANLSNFDHSHSKCDLNRFASCESLNKTILNDYVSRITENSSCLENSDKSIRHYMSDSCLVKKISFNEKSFNRPYIINNHALINLDFENTVIDQKSNAKSSGKKTKKRFSFNQKEINDQIDDNGENGDRFTGNIDCSHPNQSDNLKCSNTSKQTLFDIDGQIIDLNETETQLEQLISYHKRMIRCLLHRLKFK